MIIACVDERQGAISKSVYEILNYHRPTVSEQFITVRLYGA